MTVGEVLGARRTWIAAAAAALTVAALCAVGAALMESGTLPQRLEGSWVCAACLLSGALGGLIAAGRRPAGFVRALTAALAVILAALLTAWLLPGAIKLAGQSGRCLAALALGAACTGVSEPLRQGRKGRRRRRRSPRKPPRRLGTTGKFRQK